MRRLTLAVLALTMLCSRGAAAQGMQGVAGVIAGLDRDGRVELVAAHVVILRYDYVVGADSVEAIAFRPMAESRYPGILLIPGYAKTARDYIPLGLQFAKAGFACVAVTQRGFGRSTGAPDFVGPKTIAALRAGFERFRQEPYVDGARMGLFGYSRGAMAASLLAVGSSPSQLRAAVFAAGIYDFKRAYADIADSGIRANMEREAGLSEAAMQERSSIARMESLPCPVLILHGEQDQNAPVNQAYLLRDRLTALHKEFELTTFPDRAHDLGMQNLLDNTLEFFGRTLMAPSPGPKTG